MSTAVSISATTIGLLMFAPRSVDPKLGTLTDGLSVNAFVRSVWSFVQLDHCIGFRSGFRLVTSAMTACGDTLLPAVAPPGSESSSEKM